MSLKSQKPQTLEEAAAVVSNRHADIDFFIYATVGPLCFVVVLGFLLLTLYKYVRKHPVQWPWKRKFRQPSFWPGGRVDQRHHRMTDECSGDCGGDGRGGVDCGASVSLAEEMGVCGSSVNVIYSGEFEQSQQQQLSGSWLDDASFVPDDSLDRIRTPTLLRTAAPQSTAAVAIKNRTFTDILGDGSGHHHHRRHHQHSSRNGQCAAAVAAAAAAAAVATTAVHAHSPRLSRDNKLRILGCKQSCLLLPAVQPMAAAIVATPIAGTADDNEGVKTATTSPQPPLTAVGFNGCGQL